MKYVFEGLLSLALLLLVCAPGTGGNIVTSTTPSSGAGPAEGVSAGQASTGDQSNSNGKITSRLSEKQSTTEANPTEAGGGNGNGKPTPTSDGKSTTKASDGSGGATGSSGGGGSNSGSSTTTTTTTAKPQPQKGKAGRVVISVPLLLLSVLM